MDETEEFLLILLVNQLVIRNSLIAFMIVYYLCRQSRNGGRRPRRTGITYHMAPRIPGQIKYLDDALNKKDSSCKNNFRMNRDCFMKLCLLLCNEGGLRPSRYVNISEQVGIFLDIISHHTKNRRIGHHYDRSGETVSKYFRRVLSALLKVHQQILSHPVPIGPSEDDPTWELFQGCLGALDGTYVKVIVPAVDKPRYRTRKGTIATNIMCACDRYGLFSKIFTGWEGSAADSRVLKDAITRPNGFQIPIGQYYLCDNGYTNGPGFLTPYHGIRYHLKEWETGRRAPQNYQEYFNMKHSKARNVIERVFGSWKKKWGILASYSFYPIKTQNHIIMATLLLNNFVWREMGVGATESSSDDSSDDEVEPNDQHDLPPDFVEVVQPSPEWTAFRDNMAQNMYDQWQARRH